MGKIAAEKLLSIFNSIKIEKIDQQKYEELSIKIDNIKNY
jgi:hypothetical protein